VIADDVALRAGPLSAVLSAADLVEVRWGSLDVCARIQVTVRDPAWGTVPPVLRRRHVDRNDDRFTVSLEAVHEAGPLAFAWSGTVEGRADGRLSFAIDGIAERDFVYRRIGICALHPWRSYVGAAYRASSEAGPVEGVFPLEIAPQPLRDGRYHPMVEAFSELHVRFPEGSGAVFAFGGTPVELEDQRNWTDASFKSYPTPLADSEPRPIRQGARVVHRLDLRMQGPPPGLPGPDDRDLTAVRIGGFTGRRMPGIGLIAPAVTDLAAHLRVEVHPARNDPAALGEAAAGIPLELVVLLEDDTLDGLEAMRASLHGLRIARLLVHRASGAAIGSGLVGATRAALGDAIADDVAVVGGTSSFFSELNRAVPDVDGMDAVAFGVSPQVHASDERSIMETLEIQGQVARQASELAGGVPVVVSPITLEDHGGSAFADAWTVGSVAELAAAGAASLTYALSTDHLSMLMRLRGGELLEVDVADPRRAAALAVTADGSRTLMVANLTDRPQQLTVDGRERPALSPYEVRSEEAATASS
jgi:D-apionolactonase